MIKNPYIPALAVACLLSGLGQMHIDADVTLSDLATQEILAKYEVTKTFGWGGLYGGLYQH